MTDDQSPERNAGSGRLWTQPREEDEHTQWLAPRTAIQGGRDGFFDREPPTTDDAPRRLWPLVLIAVIIACLLFAGSAMLGSSLLDRNSSSGSTAALPAVPGGVVPDARARAVRSIVADAGPSVVLIRSPQGGGTSSGTGFVIDTNGTIVTNAHVVDGAGQVQVRFEDKAERVDAQVLGTDASSDLAVLRVDGSHTRKLKPLTFADSNSVKVGDVALAIGYPLGLDQTLTQGIVSAVDGTPIKSPNGFSIDKVIQTDAPINPGNSGGPLLDAAGRVIGINSQIATAAAGGGNVGIGFAVPSNTVRQVVPRLRAGAAIRRPYLGITTGESATGALGAQVADVISGGPADAAGISVGDTVTGVGGRAIERPDDVSAAIENRRPGDRVEVKLRRDGDERTVSVTLGTRPENVATSPSTGP